MRKKPGITREAFRDHRLGPHALLAAKIPVTRSYRIDVAGDPGGVDVAPYGGSAELRFDDRAAMEVGLALPEGVIAGDDTARFANGNEHLVTDETVVLP